MWFWENPKILSLLNYPFYSPLLTSKSTKPTLPCFAAVIRGVKPSGPSCSFNIEFPSLFNIFTTKSKHPLSTAQFKAKRPFHDILPFWGGWMPRERNNWIKSEWEFIQAVDNALKKNFFGFFKKITQKCLK